MTPGPDAVVIDGARLLARLQALGTIGRDPRGGLSRPGFGAADRAAGQAVRAMAQDAGLISDVDAAGNLLIRRRPAVKGRPVLLVGSHLDTVMNGGWLDGSYGVVAALEVLQTAADEQWDTSADLVAIAFANEEGARFRQPFWGSMALSGRLNDLTDEPVDVDGNPLRPELAAAGGSLDRLPECCWSREQLVGYLELHIEQGPTLELTGIPIGLVDGIVGRSVWEIELMGRAGHAGTTPMDGRRDAAIGAARLVLAVDDLVRRRRLCAVATTGCVDVSPNSPNTIAGQARLTVDLRDLDERRLSTVERVLESVVADVAAEAGLECTARRTTRSHPVDTDTGLYDAIAQAADRLGVETLRVSSGAGHDAQMVAGIAPIGMIFAPSRGGVSHVPEEDTAPQDLVVGARTLAATVRDILLG